MCNLRERGLTIRAGECPGSPRVGSAQGSSDLGVHGDGMVAIEERCLSHPQSVLCPRKARIAGHVGAMRSELPVINGFRDPDIIQIERTAAIGEHCHRLTPADPSRQASWIEEG